MDFTFPKLMRILMEDAGLTSPKLAEGLNRERSLVNKWMSGKHKPKTAYIAQIVDILLKKTTTGQEIILAAHITEFIRASSLPEELKNSLLTKSIDCPIFLREALIISLYDTHDISALSGISNAIPEGAAASPAPSNPQASPDPPETLKIRLGRHMTTPVCAVASAVLGGALWNLANHIFGWTYYMGSPGGEPYGLSAFVWGCLTLLPIAIIAALFLKMKASFKGIAVLIAYITSGSLAALFFYTSGIRTNIEAIGLSYEIREIIIVFIYSIIVATPPFMIARGFAGSPPDRKATFLYIALPVIAALFAVVVTLFIGRPEIEVTGVRGLLVGVFMRSMMFYVLVKTIKTANDRWGLADGRYDFVN